MITLLIFIMQLLVVNHLTTISCIRVQQLCCHYNLTVNTFDYITQTKFEKLLCFNYRVLTATKMFEIIQCTSRQDFEQDLITESATNTEFYDKIMLNKPINIVMAFSYDSFFIRCQDKNMEEYYRKNALHISECSYPACLATDLSVYKYQKEIITSLSI